MWAAVAMATFSKGSIGRRIWGLIAIAITVSASLVFNLLWVNDLFDGSLEWVPRKATNFLLWADGYLLGALLPRDLEWVPHLTIQEVGLITLASTLLWWRSMGVGLLGAGAVMLFGYPMLLAAWSFFVYWVIELVVVVLKGAGQRANDVGILRTKRAASGASASG